LLGKSLKSLSLGIRTTEHRGVNKDSVTNRNKSAFEGRQMESLQLTTLPQAGQFGLLQVKGK
jgi:hypothetical protein